MRILIGLIVVAAACSGAQKKDSSIVNEGSDTPPTCCCKTIPVTAEKEIIPSYTMQARMECSSANGECVDDVQCNGHNSTDTPARGDNGVPPPPPILNSNDNAPIK